MQIDDFLHVLTAPAPVGVPLAVGLASACGFAVANALQHRVAGTVPPSVHRAFAVLGYLVRRPQWLAATGVSFLAMLCHAFALRLGSIALVQPLMLVGVVLAVPLRAALGHERPPWAAVRAVAVTTVGLAAFLSFADLRPAGGSPRITLALASAPTGAVVAVALAFAGGHRLRPRAYAALLGTAAGVLFGVTAGLLKLVGTTLTEGGTPLVTRVALLGCLVIAGLVGTAVNQRAYQIAPIAFSMPLVNVLDISVALVFGALVLQEVPGHTLTGLVAEAASLGCVAWGLRGIARLESGDVTTTPAPALAGAAG